MNEKNDEQIMYLCQQLISALNERPAENRIFAFKQTYDYLVREFCGKNIDIPNIKEFMERVKIG